MLPKSRLYHRQPLAMSLTSSAAILKFREVVASRQELFMVVTGSWVVLQKSDGSRISPSVARIRQSYSREVFCPLFTPRLRLIQIPSNQALHLTKMAGAMIGYSERSSRSEKLSGPATRATNVQLIGIQASVPQEQQKYEHCVYRWPRV